MQLAINGRGGPKQTRMTRKHTPMSHLILLKSFKMKTGMYQVVC